MHAAIETILSERAANFGQRVRRLRTDRGMTLRELAAKAGVSIATISKVENNLLSPTYDNILRLAFGLSVDVDELLNSEATVMGAGRRSITRAEQGVVIRTSVYTYEMLAADLSHKRFVPIFATIKPHNSAKPPALLKHSGEEFVYILSGDVTILTDLYEPLYLRPGDSCYFDSSMGHVLVTAGDVEATLLWVASSMTPDFLGSPPGRPANEE